MHFHDLRHVGGTLAAATGASLKELMARLGHSSTRAALMYQHASRDRDQAIHGPSAAWSSRCVRRRMITPARVAKMHNVCNLWPVRGSNRPTTPRCGLDSDLAKLVDLVFLVGAGEGNRTLMTSLEG